MDLGQVSSFFFVYVFLPTKLPVVANTVQAFFVSLFFVNDSELADARK